MSKSIVLVLEPNHESEYGEYANTPAFNAHGDIIGWTGGEVSESGHSCEFNVLNDEGFITCASSTTVNKLRGENAKLREQLDVAEHNQTRNAREYARLCHENDKLQDENARLRSCLSDDAENARMIMAENAELQELVLDMWREMITCPDYARSPCLTDSICERVRELEIRMN